MHNTTTEEKTIKLAQVLPTKESIEVSYVTPRTEKSKTKIFLKVCAVQSFGAFCVVWYYTGLAKYKINKGMHNPWIKGAWDILGE